MKDAMTLTHNTLLHNKEASDKENAAQARGLWLCLHFRQLPLEVFSRSVPPIKEGLEGEPSGNHISGGARPLVIISRQKVQYMNFQAENIGIRIGSSMDTAYTLSNQIVSFERNEEKELTTLSHLAQWAYQFTPGVSIKTPHSLLLEVGSCLKLFGGLQNLASTIERELGKLGYTASLGISATPLAALCLAEAKGQTRQTDMLDSLRKLPVNCLRVDGKIIESLGQMGIKDLGSLLDLPVDGLSRRFGIFFTDYLSRLTGEKPDPQKFISEIPRFHSDITFLSDVTNIQSLVFPVKRLISELCQFLLARQLFINQLTFKLSHRSHQSRVFSIYLANPENDADMFLMLVQLKLDKIDDMPEVDNLCLIANTFYPAESTTGDIFHGTSFKQPNTITAKQSASQAAVTGSRHQSNTEQDRASRLLNMLRVRLGPQSCFGLSLANDHRPEKAWKMIRLNQKDYWFPESGKEENPRPLYLLNSPRMLYEKNHSPYVGGELELIRGPERIDFGWWDKDGGARDYYIARHPSGTLYWVFNQLDHRKWYLHGIFS